MLNKKGFNHFNWTAAGGLKIDQSRKLQWQKCSEICVAEFDFIFQWNLLFCK